MIAGLIVVAVRAEGRELTRATSNDGGAWVVNRSLGAVGHKNRATGEISSHVRLNDRAVIDVLQAGDLIIVHDPIAGELLQIDPRSGGRNSEPTQLPEFVAVTVAENTVVVTRSAPFALWRLTETELKETTDIADRVPLVSTGAAGHSATAPDGTVVAVDSEAGELRWVDADGAVSEPIALFDELRVPEAIVDVTIVDASAIVLLANGDTIIVGRETVEQVIRWARIGAGDPPALLQQPGLTSNVPVPAPATAFVGVTVGGELVKITLGEEPTATVQGALNSSDPVRPVVFDGCTHGVAASPPVYGRTCGGFDTRALEGTSTQWRLRLVNGWVWVNDLETGLTYATNDQFELEILDDWSAVEEEVIEDNAEEDAAPTEEADPDAFVVDDPDAQGDVADGDEFDPSEANVAPVAVDDERRTRADQAVVVEVLDNDFDANNDILVVDSVELVTGEAQVGITPDGSAVQVIPAAGFSGTVAVRYSISDGRSDPVSAQISLAVVADQTANLDPEPETDVVAIAPGESATIDLLLNDTDPEGDALSLSSVESPSGTVRWDPAGQVTFTPDTTTEQGWIEVAYTVRDDRGAEAEGTLRVEIRDQGANQEPDARNDQATTVVGRTAVIDLLANDSDPDGDPLFVGSQPRLLDPPEADVQQAFTPDGEFVFTADQPGVYVFSYTVNDVAQGGSESDTARIRIDVLPLETNDPPIAVRDDLVLPVGETRTVYVLENDGDPDGDVVTIVDWQHSSELLVTPFNDGTGLVGFQLTVPPGSSASPTFSYSISDGTNSPVSAPVVMAVVNRPVQDQPPFAINDVIEARSGRSINGIDVLANDWDPEGGALEVVLADTTADVEVSIAADRQTIDLTIPDEISSSFTISYAIEDGAGNGAAAIVRVQHIPSEQLNRPPIARADEARAEFEAPIIVDVLANDSDPDNDTISLESIVGQPANGSATVQNGLLLYTPDLGFSGTDVLRYAAVDDAGERDVAAVFIGVAEDEPANNAPIANDDSFLLGTQTGTTPLDVLTNDFDPDGDTISVVNVGEASHGTVSLDDFDRVQYVPPTQVSEPTVATFSYVIEDTAGEPARAVVSVELTPAIEPTPVPLTPTPQPTPTPTPTPDRERDDAFVPADATATPTPTPIVREAPEPTETPTPTPTSTPEPTATPTPEPTATPTPTPVEATATPTPVLLDEPTPTPEPTATETPTPTPTPSQNTAPEVLPLVVSTAFGTAITLDLGGQASDADGDDLTFFCCPAASIRGGTLSNVATGTNSFTVTFTPDDGFSGSAGFAYEVSDGRGGQPQGSVSIQVAEAGNRSPVTTANTVQIPAGEQQTVDLTALSGDPDGDAVTRVLVSEPGGPISVAVNGDSAVVTVERSAPVGPAGSFTYEISDGDLSATGDVSIEVLAGTNTAPTAQGTTLEMEAGSSESVDLAALTLETDPGDSLNFAVDSSQAAPLSVSLVGSLVQVSAPINSAGTTVTVPYVATDTRSAEATAGIDITVLPPSAALPWANDDTANTVRNEVVTIDVLNNDGDPLGDGLTIEILDATWGTATVVGGQVNFAPGDRVGSASVTYRITDAASRTAEAAIEIATVGVPDQPAPPSIEVSSRQVVVSWQTPNLNDSPLDDYKVTMRSPGKPDETFDTDQLTHTFSGLTNGDDYTFTVIAKNGVGPSLESDPSETAQPNQLPEVPSPPTVIFGDGELEVSWTEPTNEGSPITLYQLSISPQVADPVQFGRETTSYTWPNLQNGDEYTFQVSAMNAVDWTAASAPSQEEHPLGLPLPPVIGNARRTGLSNSLTVDWAWNQNRNNGDAVSEFRVEISNDLGNPQSAGSNSARDMRWTTGLTDGELVQFRVAARNRAGWGAYSSWSNEIESCSAPDPVTNVQAVRGDGQVSLTWDQPDFNGCGVTNYVITPETSLAANQRNPQNSATANHTFDGLANGAPYTFTIQATNEIGTSVVDAGATSNQVIPAGPPLCNASGVLSSSVNAAATINLNWANGFLDNGDPITEYLIATDSGSFVPFPSSPQNRAMGGLGDGRLYTFDVRARNTVGDSITCGSTSATTWAGPTAVSLTASFDTDTDMLTVAMTGGRTNDGANPLTYTITINGGTGNASNVVTDFAGEPHGQSHDFPVLEDPNFEGNPGRIAATVWVCNGTASCVTNADVIDAVTLIDPPGPMSAADVVVNNHQHYARMNPGDPRGTVVFMNLFEPADDGGGEITHYVWQGRRTDWLGTSQIALTPDIPHEGSIGGSGLVSFDSYFGFSNRASSRNGGRNVTWEVRAAAVNDAGQGGWSEWVSYTPPRPAPILELAHVSHCFPVGNDSPCAVFRVIDMYGFAPDTAITPWVTAFAPADFCESVSTWGDGGPIGTPTVQCDWSDGRAVGYFVTFDGVRHSQLR